MTLGSNEEFTINNKEITVKMNKFIPLLFVIIAFATPKLVNAQNCDALEINLNQAITQKDYNKAYGFLNEALTHCPDKKINYYNFGETVLLNMIENANSEAEKTKYATELSTLIEKRIQYFPNGIATFWEGEKVNYEYRFGLIDREEAYQKYKVLFSSTEDTQVVSANTVLNYYVTALELMNEEQLDFAEVLDVYFQTKKVAEDNIELRSVEYGILAEKLDSIQKVDPKKDLTPAEKQNMANAQAAKDVFVEINESMEAYLDGYTTCENIAPMFQAQFEENKNDLDWIGGTYQALASKECFELAFMQQLQDQYNEVWRKENPQADPVQVASSSGGTIGTSYSAGVADYKRGNFNAAITKFRSALEEVSGTTRGDVAYYMALSYQKLGDLNSAVNWANRAANYKPGWGAPYQLIATAFGASANACGNSEFEKLSTYWVAADFARKACSVDSRSCSWAQSAIRSYEATAPSVELSFQAGKQKGDRVTVNCLGGATTTVR